jgi:transcription-repair coupling factor (superfamily II helicase)
MAAVGFDLYTRMLAEAVEEEKAALESRPARHERVSTVIDLPVDAYLPDDYVPEEPQKLELYRRLGRVVTDHELLMVRGELGDRFGPLPAPVERLLDVARLRFTAEAAGIASISREDGQLVLRFGPDWSRAAVLRALAPTGPGDRVPGVPTGGIVGGSNQVRIKLPREAADAWAVTRAVVGRLASRLPELVTRPR